MKLSELATAVAELSSNHSVLLYGPPKTGKTRLAGTAIRIPEFRRIFWFDGENGYETLLNMGLTADELAKVTLFRIKDTRDKPIFVETMLKALATKSANKFCDRHGKWECPDCKKASLPFTSFDLRELTHNDLVVIDSGSALGDSALNACMLGSDSMAKPGWDEYAIQGKWLGDILMQIQAATNTNFLVITHEIAIESDKKEVIYPLIGTKNFSMKCAKYFGTVAYVEKKAGKHVAGSSSLYRHNLVTGSRVNAQIEKKDATDMRTIFVEGGILTEGVFESSTVEEQEGATQSMATVPLTSEQTGKPLSLKEKLALKSQGQ
ncbi:putative ATPase [Polaromonas phage Tiera]|nr:putative ATPase [Polaromonas phage Tiera]